jgi:TnsA endonuclease N terminal
MCKEKQPKCRHQGNSPCFCNANAPSTLPKGLVTKSLLRGDAVDLLRSILGSEHVAQARRVVTASGSKTRGKVCSPRFRKVLVWESNLERTFIEHVQLSEIVLDVFAQPARLRLSCCDGVLDYTPDFLVITQACELVLVECKPDEELKSPELNSRLTSIEIALAKAGIRFVVVGESRLLSEPLNENLKRLSPMILDPIKDSAELDRLRHTVLLANPTTYNDLLYATDMRTVHRAVANRVVFTNLRLPLNVDSSFCLKHRADDDVASYL